MMTVHAGSSGGNNIDIAPIASLTLISELYSYQLDITLNKSIP